MGSIHQEPKCSFYVYMRDVVLITGSSKGIGASCILEFAKNNYNVIIHYNQSRKEAFLLKEKIEKQYCVDVMCIACDLSKENEIKNMVEQIIKRFGKIDVLVNNAAIALDCLFEEKTKENFLQTLDVNLVGPFLISKYIGNYMMKQKRGNIINISSTNGIDTPFPMCLDYDASKAGLISLTHNLAFQFAPYIRVNCVAPGWVGTENELKDVDEEYIKSEEEKIFLKRIARPEEIAHVVFFLASDQSSYINNSVIRVDGGLY